MAEERLPNCWGIAVAAVFMQICPGAVYGRSVFKIPLMRVRLHQAKRDGWTRSIHVIAGVLSMSLIVPLIVRPPRGKAAAQSRPISQAS